MANTAYHRPQIPAIYNTVWDWYNQAGAIHYVAHAILQGPTANQLAAPLAIGAGNGGPQNHPDQQYWIQNINITHNLQQIVLGGNLIRVEIDCTLMPCNAAQVGCLFRVPHLIGVNNVPLRIFSHRDERGGAQLYTETSKRYLDCNSSDTNQALQTAYDANNGWRWDPWAGNYP